VAVYSARDEAVARQSGEIHWLRTLQTALRDNLFRLYWQPIVLAYGEGGTGPSMEVLVRLADELGQEIAPIDLVRAAERYRLMGLVDRWVIQTTLTALGRGAIELAPGRSLAINVSGQTLADTQFLEFVVDSFDRSGVEPAQVCFEISESAVVANLDHARRFVGVLHGMGCEFALDNFGSSIGSFASLKNLPMDYLKVDGAFMRNIARDSVNQAMVTATIRLARSLNFKVIAEHVEDAAGMDAARSMGFDYLQGFAIARPRPLSLAA
jgi:EAL domain-containing protein (putative c-di-GMP-specific phosphodiesterase class I)